MMMLIMVVTQVYNHTLITPSDVREAGTSPLLVLMLLSALKHIYYIINDCSLNSIVVSTHGSAAC